MSPPRFLASANGAHVAEIHDTAPRHCHKMVRDSAQGMCAAFWEQCSSDDMFHRQWPSQKAYVRRKWGAFVDVARTHLAEMLGGNYPEAMKTAIYEALLKDAALRGADIQELPDQMH